MKRPKKWRCCKCKKEYCYFKSALRHRRTKDCENHIKFKPINDEM